MKDASLLEPIDVIHAIFHQMCIDHSYEVLKLDCHRVDTASTSDPSGGDNWGWDGRDEDSNDADVEMAPVSSSKASASNSRPTPGSQQRMPLPPGPSREEANTSPTLQSRGAEVSPSAPSLQGLSLSQVSRTRQGQTRRAGREQQHGKGGSGRTSKRDGTILHNDDLFAVRTRFFQLQNLVHVFVRVEVLSSLEYNA